MTPYEQLLARLLPARRFGIVLGLERMHAIFERLGHPERRLGHVVHVGGTNGKGSTVSLVAAGLRLRGASVATYTSPHLSCLRERIRFDGEMITEGAIVAAADRVSAAGGDELTFFEQLTAIACVAIAERGVDFTVLEVGLGGRLDATNAVTAAVAVVTGVAMDHAAILGDTLDAIAREKAGIFKPRQRVVIGRSGEPAAVPVLEAAARSLECTTTIVGDDQLARIAELVYEPTSYQRSNAAAAIAAIDHLEELGFIGPLPDALQPGDNGPVRRFLALRRMGIDPQTFQFFPEGRLESARVGEYDAILDGAHNPHAARALASHLRVAQIRPVMIVAISEDKDVRGIAHALAPMARHVIATRYQQSRSLDPEVLADIFEIEGCTVDRAPDLATALNIATRPDAPHNTGTEPTILITGSLFLVGEARVLLLGAPADPYVVTDPPAR